MGKKAKSIASASRGYQFAAGPLARLAASDGVLVDPAQTTDDIVEKVAEVSPAMSLLASNATKGSEFDRLDLKTFSFVWAIPHLLRTTATELADDERGAIVELLQSGVSFRNISNSEITLHANTPVAVQNAPDKIYARLSGFFARGGKGKKADDVHIKPGQTVTYKINWKKLPNEYTPITEPNNGRLWMNLVTFAVEVKDINQQTGAAINDLASIVSMIPKVQYTKRQSNPIIPAGQTLTMQDTENFALQSMPNGADDLFSVYPISVQGGGKRRGFPGKFASDHEVFSSEPGLVSFIQDIANEGDLVGVEKVNITRSDYEEDCEGRCRSDEERPCYYEGCGLVVSRVGGKARPLELSTRQGGGNRLVLMGFNVSASPSSSEPIFYSYWKWDPNVGYWVLWDDYEQTPRNTPPSLAQFTPISAYMPACLISGVYTRAERQLMHEALLKKGKNVFGQPFGEPRGFGTFLRKAISVLTIMGQVAGYFGTLL